MRTSRSLLLALAVSLLAACGTPSGTCTKNDECTGGKTCVGGVCTSPTGGGTGGGGAAMGGGGGSTADAGDVDSGVPDAGSALGALCTTGTDCLSGFCADGRCCDSACTGTCESCALVGSEGQCAALDAGVDPDDECAATSASTCGHDGFCDGARACRFFPAATECRAPSCSGNTSTRAATCDGQGGCVDNGTAACGSFACEAATGLCFTTCTGAAQCGSGFDCAGGQCKQRAGVSCTQGSECASGSCVDGVCCDTACSGTCVACTAAKKGSGSDGACGPIASGTDPDSECAGAQVCGAASACQAPLGTTCTGASECLSGQCVDGVCCDSACTGACRACNVTPGTCTNVPAGQDPANECTGATNCDGTGACLPLVQGAACTSGAECATGHCVDGVCCDTSCAGLCQSCSVSGAVGTCSNVPAGQDVDNECPTSAQSSCGTDGSCDGAGACRRYAAGTICNAATCSAGSASLADTCNGSGTCVDNGTVACAPYVCGPNACRTSCNVDVDCQANFRCVAGVCKSANGQVCSTGASCASGFCTDGVCCENACGGTCEKCNQAGRLGFCDAISLGTDPDNECAATAASTCGTEGSCSGARSCRFHPSGTLCSAASCTANTASLADTCNGLGTCVDNGTVACAPYTCGATACKSSCLSDVDCQSGSWCDTGVCRARLGAGVACSANAQCSSGNCVDGVCCNTACTGLCQACSAAKKGSGADGTCGNLAAGLDPDNECAGSDVCNGAGACRAINGTACVLGSSCLSGNCIDGVCCNTTCGALCQACNLAGSVGTCGFVPAGTDPAGECAGAASCNGAGGCQ